MVSSSSIHDYGSTKNLFGLMTEDNRVRPDMFIEFLGSSVKKADVARILNIPRPSVYKEAINLPEVFIKEKLIPIVIAADLAVELFSDREKARRWMLTPNSYFFGRAPFDMCIIGEGRPVISFLANHLGREILDDSVKKAAKEN